MYLVSHPSCLITSANTLLFQFSTYQARWRHGDIKTRKDYIRVIKDEWDKLEFEETKRDGRVWKGINWYVENWNNKVLAEVIKQDGWDTKYM